MVASRAYRRSPDFARPSRASARSALTRNILIAGTALSTIAFGSAGAALFGSGGLVASTPYVASRSAIKLTLTEPAAPKVVQRDPRNPIETPGVTIVKRKEARLDTAARKEARLDAAQREAARIAKAEAASIVQFSAARAAPAEPLPRERADEPRNAPETTGSLGEVSPVMKKLALAPVNTPAKPLNIAPLAKSASKLAAIPAPAPAPAPAPRKPWRALSAHERLFGPVRLASLLPFAASPDSDSDLPSAPYDRQTAVYVIGDKKVYMPDGNTLEAHSGLGDMMDDPRFVKVRMKGATPPHVYDMKMRESLFHGVEAIRLTPVGGEQAIFGRAGILAHPYMLGPNGQSNGCVSFKDYSAFLTAFKSGKITRLAVIEKL
jgi:hypothetical protein